MKSKKHMRPCTYKNEEHGAMDPVSSLAEGTDLAEDRRVRFRADSFVM
jgi:hypothetical protein